MTKNYEAWLRWKNRNREVCLKRQVLSMAKKRAKTKDLEFDLKEEDISIPAICPVLSIPIERNEGKCGPSMNSPSMDRIDPLKGYIKGNIRIISHRANTLKNNASVNELILVLKDAQSRL